MSFIRLYLVPVNGVQQVIDVDADDLVLSNQNFVHPQMATSVTLVGSTFDSTFTPFGPAPAALDLTQTQRQELRVCWKEPVGTDDFPNEEVVTVVDPSGGQCVCGITCSGNNLSYAVVKAVS